MENEPKLPEKLMSPEAEIMNSAQDERLELFMNQYESLLDSLNTDYLEDIKKVGLTVANVTFLADFKMAYEAVKGKTLQDRKLSKVDRLIYVTSVFLSIVGKVMMARGATNASDFEEGAAVYSSSYIPFTYIIADEVLDSIAIVASKFKKTEGIAKFALKFKNIIIKMKEKTA